MNWATYNSPNCLPPNQSHSPSSPGRDPSQPEVVATQLIPSRRTHLRHSARWAMMHASSALQAARPSHLIHRIRRRLRLPHDAQPPRPSRAHQLRVGRQADLDLQVFQAENTVHARHGASHELFDSPQRLSLDLRADHGGDGLVRGAPDVGAQAREAVPLHQHEPVAGQRRGAGLRTGPGLGPGFIGGNAIGRVGAKGVCQGGAESRGPDELVSSGVGRKIMLAYVPDGDAGACWKVLVVIFMNKHALASSARTPDAGRVATLRLQQDATDAGPRQFAWVAVYHHVDVGVSLEDLAV